LMSECTAVFNPEQLETRASGLPLLHNKTTRPHEPSRKRYESNMVITHSEALPPQEAVNPSSDQSAASPTTHRLSIPRKALITTKAFGVDTSTVKKQLIQDLNNA
ncbi:hypothetical protein KUCAC02_014363, partial [Chaenocephalus aceratus]